MSFANERTIEYSLITNLSTFLSNHYGNIIPFYYWKTREGSNISLDCFQNEKVKVLAIFARRPKIVSVNSDMVEIKFNESVIEDTFMLRELGIETIAGTCLANSLKNIGLRARTKWFFIEEKYDRDIILSFENEQLINYCPSNEIITILNEDKIKQLIDESRSFKWNELVEQIETWRLKHRYNKMMNFFGGVYKPFYLIITEPNSII